MKKISEQANEIYSLIGEGYGFNGPKEEAIKIIEEKLLETSKHYANKAFCAGRSKQPWKIFYAHHFI